MTVRDSLPYIGAEAFVGLLASIYAVSAFYEGRFAVAAVVFVVSAVAYALAVHMWNESAR